MEKTTTLSAEVLEKIEGMSIEQLKSALIEELEANKRMTEACHAQIDELADLKVRFEDEQKRATRNFNWYSETLQRKDAMKKDVERAIEGLQRVMQLWA